MTPPLFVCLLVCSPQASLNSFLVLVLLVVLVLHHHHPLSICKYLSLRVETPSPTDCEQGTRVLVANKSGQRKPNSFIKRSCGCDSASIWRCGGSAGATIVAAVAGIACVLLLPLCEVIIRPVGRLVGLTLTDAVEERLPRLFRRPVEDVVLVVPRCLGPVHAKVLDAKLHPAHGQVLVCVARGAVGPVVQRAEKNRKNMCRCVSWILSHTRTRTHTHAHAHTRTPTHAHTHTHTHTHTHKCAPDVPAVVTLWVALWARHSQQRGPTIVCGISRGTHAARTYSIPRPEEAARSGRWCECMQSKRAELHSETRESQQKKKCSSSHGAVRRTGVATCEAHFGA